MDEPFPTDPDCERTRDPGEEFPHTEPSDSKEAEVPKVLGQYENLTEIGRGGMGVVYKAIQRELKRTVALKVLIAGEDASEEAIARFHREAESVAKLGHHPNIVPVYDIGQEGKLHYFAMHFVEGKSLDRMIDDAEIIPKRAAIITRKIAEALQHAHAHGVLHRDIKPANILVTRDGEPQVTDFGLAKDVESEAKMTRSGITLGTPHYMPPEQADGRLSEIDERSDVYALGATLYEMLTLHPPFQGTTVIQVVQQVLLTEPKPPRKRNPAVDRDLDTICLKCLEKAPARRYATASALAEDLGRYLEGVPILARPPSVGERLWRRVRRNKAVSAMLLALVLVLIGVSVIAWWKMDEWRLEKQKLVDQQKDADAAREDAEAQAERARRIMRKGRVVAGVLRSAQVELGEVLEALQASFYSPATESEKRRVGEGAWRKVEGFEKNLPEGEAPKAAWLAAKGWMRRLAGHPEEAFELFQRSRDTDPEVGYGWLFEGMVHLSDYLAGQELPPAVLGDPGIDFLPIPPETPQMKTARKALLRILQEVRKAEVWGESSAEEFHAVFEGFRELQRGDLEKAEQSLGKAIGVPEMAWLEGEILLARAKIRYLRKAFGEGLRDLRKVLEIQPRSFVANHTEGMMQQARGIAEALEGRDPFPAFQQSLDAFRNLLQLKPGSLQAILHRGLTFESRGDAEERWGRDPMDSYDMALADYTEVLQALPGTMFALNNRGHVYTKRARWKAKRGEEAGQDFEAAIADCTEAIRLYSKVPSPYNVRGIARFGRGRVAGIKGENPKPWYRKAIEDFNRVLQQDPEMLVAYTNRARVNLELGSTGGLSEEGPVRCFEKAIADCRKALEKAPRWPRAHLNLGMTYLKILIYSEETGQDGREAYRKAMESFATVLRLDPANTEVFQQRGLARLYVSDIVEGEGTSPMDVLREALADFEEALRLRPESGSTYQLRAMAHTDMARALYSKGKDPQPFLEKALADCNAALQRTPKDPFAYHTRGEVHRILGERALMRGETSEALFRKAVADSTEALRISPGLWQAQENRAWALRGWGDVAAMRREDPEPLYRKGLEDMTLVLQQPARAGNPTCHSNRAELYRRLGQVHAEDGRDPRELFRGAIADYGVTLRSHPGNLIARIHLGHCLRDLGRAEALRGKGARSWFEKALSAYEEVLKRRDTSALPHTSRGYMLELLGRFDEALQAYDRALTLGRNRDPFAEQQSKRLRALHGAPSWMRTIAEAEALGGCGEPIASRERYEKAVEEAGREGAPKSARDREALWRAHFNLACLYAWASDGKTGPLAAAKPVAKEAAGALQQKALQHVRRLKALGFPDLRALRDGKDFETLRALPAFRELLKGWPVKKE
ncbi:MAG: protein kinase domain-containing protein [Planctomycetota bacterium]